jgi:DNA-binding phage protein
MSDGLNYPDYLYGDALAKKPITSPDFTEVHIIKAMEQTASASEHLVAALKLVRAKRNFEAMAADAQARGEYDDQTARDTACSVKHGDLPRKEAEPVAYPQPNDWRISSGLPMELGYLASFGPNAKEHRRVATEADWYAMGIGDVEPRPVVQAEADRIIGTELHPLAGPESRL